MDSAQESNLHLFLDATKMKDFLKLSHFYVLPYFSRHQVCVKWSGSYTGRYIMNTNMVLAGLKYTYLLKSVGCKGLDKVSLAYRAQKRYVFYSKEYQSITIIF